MIQCLCARYGVYAVYITWVVEVWHEVQYLGARAWVTEPRTFTPPVTSSWVEEGRFFEIAAEVTGKSRFAASKLRARARGFDAAHRRIRHPKKGDGQNCNEVFNKVCTNV